MAVTRHMQTTDRLASAARKAPTSTVDAAANLLQTVTRHHERAPFVAQVLNALADLTDVACDSRQAGGASEYSALIDLLDQPQILADLRRTDPLAPARLRGFRLRERLLDAEGGTCSASELADVLGITRQAIDKRRKTGRLIGLDLGRRGYAYPNWQAGLNGLGDVLAVLDTLDPWSQLAFMLTPNVWLEGETPLTLLRRGEVESVVRAAASYGEQAGA